MVTDGNLDNGYSFDDIMISRSTNDLGITALIAPAAPGVCTLSSTETISVRVKNYSAAAATNIPVTFSINGVISSSETVSAVNAGDSVVYTFTQKGNFAAFQSYIF